MADGSMLWSVAIASLVFLFILVRRASKRPKYPPGPRGSPIFGSLKQFAGYFNLDEVRKLISQYGRIYCFKAGSTPVIFITEASIAYEAMIQKGAIFASRPGLPKQAILSNYRRDINASPYGPRWRALRRNLVGGVLSIPKLTTYSGVRKEVIDKLFGRFRGEAEINNGLVSVKTNIRLCIFEIMSYICFGRYLEERTLREMDQLLKDIITCPRFSLGDFIPWLSFLPSKQLKLAYHIAKRQDAFFIPLIQESRRLREEGKIKPDCYINSLFEMNALGKEEKLSEQDMVALCTELLNAGVDTTSNTLEWAMANIIKYPNVQAKLVEELKRVVGNRAVVEEDIDNMPYLQAVAKETLRKHPPGDNSILHSVTEPVNLAGYDITPDALVIVNLLSIALDPKIWPDPEVFLPERMLGSNVDITGAKELKMVPFGCGRRICPGLGIAMLHIHLILARLLHEFEFIPKEDLDLTSKREFAVVLVQPLQALIRKRYLTSC